MPASAPPEPGASASGGGITPGACVDGTMIAKCVITTEGRLTNCRIINSQPHLQDREQAILRTLANQRYKPVTFQGRPAEVDYTIPLKIKCQ